MLLQHGVLRKPQQRPLPLKHSETLKPRLVLLRLELKPISMRFKKPRLLLRCKEPLMRLLLTLMVTMVQMLRTMFPTQAWLIVEQVLILEQVLAGM